MADLPPAAGTAFLHDLKAVQEIMQAVTTQDARHQRLYRKWAGLCATLLVNSTLQYSSISRIELLQVYGHRVRHAKYSKRRMDRLGKELVSQAWGAIATAHLLDGLSDPRKPADSQAHTRLGKRLTRQLKTYGLEDSPARQENVIPLGIMHSTVAATDTSSNRRSHHISNLFTIGLYSCIRSCKYVKCTVHRRTVQL